MTKRCIYCGRYFNKLNHENKCKECIAEYKLILENINRIKSTIYKEAV